MVVVGVVGEIEIIVILVHITINVLGLDPVEERVCITESEDRFPSRIHLLDIAVVEVEHMQLGQLQHRSSHVDWFVENDRVFPSFYRGQIFVYVPMETIRRLSRCPLQFRQVSNQIESSMLANVLHRFPEDAEEKKEIEVW